MKPMTEKEQPTNGGNNFDTPRTKAFKRFIYYYGAPVVIAAGIATGGAAAVTEGKRIVEGDFNTVPNALRDTEGVATVPTWYPDASLICGMAIGAVATATGIALRRGTRNARDSQ